GAVGSEQNIIVYGDYGSYLLSSDLGNSWTQYSIGIFDEIREIVNFKDTLWGITHKGYLVLSIDNGINWKLHKLEIDTAERLVSLIVKNNAIFVRGIKFVMKISKNLQVEGIFQDTSLKLHTWEYLTEPEMPIFHYYTTKGMHYWNDKLILYSKSFADSGFSTIKDDFTNLEYITLRGKIRGWPATEYFPRRIYEYNGKSVFQFGAYLYFPNNDFTQWSYFFSDTTFMNYQDSATRSKWLDYVNLYTYFFKNNRLYGLFGKDPVIDSTPTPEIGINRYESFPQDTFVQMGSAFKDIYLSGFYDDYFKKFIPGFDIVMHQLWFQKPTILFDSILIFIGNKKLIVISPDFGKTWRLVSYLSGKPRVIINDSMYYYINAREDLIEINRTYNGGTTGIPSKIFKESYKKPKSVEYKNLPLFYVDETGKGFAKGHQPWDPQFLAFTNDSWDYLDTKILKEFNLGYRSIGFSVEQFTSNVTKIDNKFFFTKSD
ncbi:MAG: hypothetical protein ACK42Z_09620, partial [Candidatus Kapaibacteriota bacterium]